ncbi:MAG: flagellar motor switch protein FliN [Nocardioidaceae bacterium]
MTAALTEAVTERALAVGQAVAAALPSSEPLNAAGAQPGTEHVVGSFSGATVADLDNGGRIAVLVGEDLVAALAASPLGGLDLAAATQPALDAAAGVLGTAARAARQVDLAVVVGDIGDPFTAVPLLGSGIAAAVLVPDALLDQAQAPAAAPGADPFVADPSAGPANSAVAAAQPPAPAAAPMAGAPVAGAPAPGVSPLLGRGLEMLHNVDMEVTVELGRTRMTVRDLLALTPGAVLELDRAAGSPADLLVNGRLIARGEVVVVDEDFGLRVTEILDDSQAG